MELQKSSLYRTIDRVPKLDHYSNTLPHKQAKTRPSLAALRKAFKASPQIIFKNHISKHITPCSLIRCMLNIWGVIMFLRLSWITSQAGILLTWVMVFLSVTVTITTVLTISAIATNGKTVSGQYYHLTQHYLTPQFRDQDVLSHTYNYGTTIVDSTNDVRIVGVITMTALLLISFAGMEWESKAQMLFFVALMISFIGYTVGTIIPQTPVKQSQGIFGYKSEIFLANLLPDWRGPSGDFFQMFAIFFPATNGILTGVNISGDLKDPNVGIPKGTLLAVFWTTLSYLALPITVGSCVVRDASGNITDHISANFTGPCTGLACNFGWNFTDCISTQSCQYGLANNLQVLGQVSASFHLITLGVFAASLSSSLSYLVSAPKIFQCLCRDNIYPYIGFFEKGYGKSDEPLRAYILTYIICLIFVCIAKLDIIAALISNFFLCSYVLINFTCFHASITNSPGWRPSFKYYNNWICMYGALSSLILMFLLTWWAALVTIIVVFLLFLYSSYKKPKVNWGSSVQAGTYNMALSYSVSLSSVEDHVKNFRPQCLVLTGPPNQRPALVDFVGCFTKRTSLMICGDVIMVSLNKFEQQTHPQRTTDWLVKWMNKRKVRSFYTPIMANSLRGGTQNLLQASGLGKLKPNTLILGFKSNWKDSSPDNLEDYNFILTYWTSCNPGLDLCSKTQQLALHLTFPPLVESAEGISEKSDSDQIKTVFQNDQGKKNIDIYWIADDGGLTLLVPYLLTKRKHWRKCKVRVFIVGDEQNMEERQKDLNRFVDSVAPFRLFDEQKESASVQELRGNAPWKISDKEFEAFKLKVCVTIQISLNWNLQDTILFCSCSCVGVSRSLPVPQSDCPSSFYMAWLDALTCGLHCPALLIRGNQEDVLTYYCE
uniref:Solute carrier family 12 member 10, tandem duplicate 1 n=1 Tax=Anabas testudineus TaxID=64144 RepID=A0A7N6FG27_ANATE